MTIRKRIKAKGSDIKLKAYSVVAAAILLVLCVFIAVAI